MKRTLCTRILSPVAGPDPLEVMDHIARTQTGDIALLHSATNAAYSVLGFEPLVTLEVDAAGGVIVTGEDAGEGGGGGGESPLEVLERVVGEWAFEAPHPLVGWLGFVSYDIARTLESITVRGAAEVPSVDELHWPLLRWTLYRHYLVFDHATREWMPVSLKGDPQAGAEILRAVRPRPAEQVGAERAYVEQFVPPEIYRRNVEKVKQYIGAGDIYQANLAQRWCVRTREDPLTIYRRLCAATPAHYAAYLRFDSADGVRRDVLCASPEGFLHVMPGEGGGEAGEGGAQRKVMTRPIKGTRPRDPQNPARDAALREELLASAKDRAELAMIVDLLRNDLGRVSAYRSVRVVEPRALEAHPTLWHTVATIEAELRPQVGLAELLAAVCPGGSITGAPKIRAMQIIEELEGSRGGDTATGGGESGFRRALYCGNIGVIGPETRSLALNIAIRTILMQEGRAFVYAGGGIVADSDGEEEYAESLHKAGALFRALGVMPPVK